MPRGPLQAGDDVPGDRPQDLRHHVHGLEGACGAVKFHGTKKCYTTQIPGLVVCLFPHNVAVATNYRFRSGLVGDLQGPQTMSQLGYLHLDTNQRVQDRFDLMANHLCRMELVGWRAKMQALAGGGQPLRPL